MPQNRKLLTGLLGLGVFAAITTEMGIIGVLPQLASAFGSTTADMSLLVSIYALVVAVTGPFVTLFTSRLNRKAVLGAILAVLAISNLVYAVSNQMELMVLFRMIPAALHAPLFAAALAVAMEVTAPELRTRASGQVFAGVAVGLVLGVPATSFIATTVSIPAAFLFAALASGAASAGILIFMPSSPTTEKISYGTQLRLLRSKAVWWSLSGVVLIFAGMFSVYSFFAEYLQQITHLTATTTSGLLALFGAAGIGGNWAFSRFLERRTVKTVVVYPLAFLLIYLLVYLCGGSSVAMPALVVLWGATHSGGLIVSQTWLSRETIAAPDFGNSLYMSFSNCGITLGVMSGGAAVSWLGTSSVVLTGCLALLLAFVSISLKAAHDKRGLSSSAGRSGRMRAGVSDEKNLDDLTRRGGL